MTEPTEQERFAKAVDFAVKAIEQGGRIELHVHPDTSLQWLPAVLADIPVVRSRYVPQGQGYFIDQTALCPQPEPEPVRSEQEGSIQDDGISIEFGGACPVQGEGTVDGRLCYYRSRDGWQLRIYEPGAAMDSDGHLPRTQFFWSMEGGDGDDYGGWAKAPVTIANIRRAVAAWREAGRP